MTPEQEKQEAIQALFLLRGLLASLPPEEQTIVEKLISTIKSETESVSFELSSLALSLIGLEMQIELIDKS